jgi:redox-sensitive bicupin YhaK (pirin superfamily)
VQTWNLAELDLQAHHPQVLTTDKEARVIAIQLPAGERMQEHRTYERAYIVVVSGRIEVDGEEKVSGGAGFLAEFDPREDREITASEDTRLLLFLGPWPGAGHPSNPGT